MEMIYIIDIIYMRQQSTVESYFNFNRCTIEFESEYELKTTGLYNFSEATGKSSCDSTE